MRFEKNNFANVLTCFDDRDKLPVVWGAQKSEKV